MKRIRPIELKRCALCGEEFDKLTMEEVFTGRTKYICRRCKALGNSEVEGIRKKRKAAAKRMKE